MAEHTDIHASQASTGQTHDRTLARPRSKRHQTTKKLQSDTQDALNAESGGSAIVQRLSAALKTKRLDLSIPRQAQVPLELSARSRIEAFQIFPAVILNHEHLYHHLTELWLTNHHLSSLPTEITVFKKLRILGLAGNVLSVLPEELPQLIALEALYLENNRLQIVPAKVTFPAQLRELRLDNNQLSVFPAQITKLRLLNRLGLSHNHLKALPEQIQRLRNLVELDLDYNRLDADLPEGFISLQRLERLGLEGNYLEERPKILDSLPVLSFVRLSNNRGLRFLSGDVRGSSLHGSAVPRRNDGYFRYVERMHTGAIGGSKREEILEGLVPCRDQNVLNITAYEARSATGVSKVMAIHLAQQ